MNQHITSKRRGRFGVRLALISLGLTGVGVAATFGTSAAHNPNITPSCSELKVSLSQYEGPASNNTVTVTIDGKATTFNFAETWNDSFPWADTENHTWTVNIDANIETATDQTKYDYVESGTETACVSTTTEASTTTTVTPTTETPTTVTSTTETPTTVTSTTRPAAVVPTTATSTTTTVAAASEAVAVPATKTAVSAASGVAAASSANTLPATGSETGVTLTLAAAALMVGLGMVTMTRRRHHS
jgi:LPXTG-motif cell wall-anchored protein